MILLLILAAMIQALCSPAAVWAFGRGYGGWATVVPYFRGGWEHMGVDFSLDMPLLVNGGISIGRRPIQLKLKDTKLLIGEMGMDLMAGSRLYLFGRMGGDARHNGKVVELFAPLSNALIDPESWGPTDLKWWRVEGGGGFGFWGNWILFAGLRYDDLKLSPQGAAAPVGAGTYSGEFEAYLKLPYIGIRREGARHRVSVIYGPWARTRFTLPAWTPGGASAGSGDTGGGTYDLSSTGYFAEASFEYDLLLSGRMILGFWAQGSLMRFTGGDSEDGEIEYSGHTYIFGLSGKYPF